MKRNKLNNKKNAASRRSQAKAESELAKALKEELQLIDKAVAWLSSHNRRDFTDFDGLGGAVFHKNRMLNAFRRAMMED